MDGPALPARPRLLVFGAGVLGSVYATRLAAAGHDVSVLDRGARLAELRQRGLAIEDVLAHTRHTARAELLDELRPDDLYDLALVTVQKTQLGSALTSLAANRTPAFLFMVSNASGPGRALEAVGADRCLLGFAGAGASAPTVSSSTRRRPGCCNRPRSASSTGRRRRGSSRLPVSFVRPASRRRSRRTWTPG